MKGILINYEYCTGCHSCEVACRNELGLKKGEFGIKVTEVGPYKYETPINANTPYEWVYSPVLTKACNMCEDRVAMGKLPSCEQACQAWCIYHGEVEELVKKMDGKTRWSLFTAQIGNEYGGYISGLRDSAPDYDAVRASAQSSAGSSDVQLEPLFLQNADGSTTEVNFTVRGVEKFMAFIDEYAIIDLMTVQAQLQEQYLADEAANQFVLAASDAKDGAEHVISYMGISQSYDAQGTQLGGGKAYLDKGQGVAKKDISISFM